MRVETEIRRNNIPEVGYVDQARVELSDHFFTVSSYRKSSSEGEERFDMVMLNREEATELLQFLKENL